MAALQDSQRLGYCTEELAALFLQLATNLSSRANFRNYSFREDLVQEGAARCCQYYSKYKMTGGSTPFSYFSRVLWNSFLQGIARENKHADLANAILVEQGGYEHGYSVPAQLF